MMVKGKADSGRLEICGTIDHSKQLLKTGKVKEWESGEIDFGMLRWRAWETETFRENLALEISRDLVSNHRFRGHPYGGTFKTFDGKGSKLKLRSEKQNPPEHQLLRRGQWSKSVTHRGYVGKRDETISRQKRAPSGKEGKGWKQPKLAKPMARSSKMRTLTSVNWVIRR